MKVKRQCSKATHAYHTGHINVGRLHAVCSGGNRSSFICLLVGIESNNGHLPFYPANTSSRSSFICLLLVHIESNNGQYQQKQTKVEGCKANKSTGALLFIGQAAGAKKVPAPLQGGISLARDTALIGKRPFKVDTVAKHVGCKLKKGAE